ncbi:hypothetical protein BU14_0728s0006 [Porphyra umbilicalis]|uniref:Uncharacterized protein n=1 Tax=Porphyra umbilicalis TaxID=2786 RepID=A0A1X6NPT5_PORUM|nr:hypothetical protein BU14_0728s0006 [Porphyra umbilicalis]|eukprot:OSX70540.1 hypothetical protein BU14_0728s0006 [Porphyra umbilicalis]
MMALRTERCSASASSAMYSLPVPLKGIRVETMEQKTPTRSVDGLILYAVQLMRLRAVRVTTSLPPSNSSGMRLAKRYTDRPGFMTLPPRATATSTMNGWPSKAPADSAWVTTSSGRSSFITPNRRLYSPAGERHAPDGSAKRVTDWKSAWIWRTWLRSTPPTVKSAGKRGPSSASNRPAKSGEMAENWVVRNAVRGVSGGISLSSARSSSWLTAAGWCLTSAAGGASRRTGGQRLGRRRICRRGQAWRRARRRRWRRPPPRRRRQRAAGATRRRRRRRAPLRTRRPSSGAPDVRTG